MVFMYIAMLSCYLYCSLMEYFILGNSFNLLVVTLMNFKSSIITYNLCPISPREVVREIDW